MAEWPTVEAAKLSLGVTTDTKDSLIATAIQAAIEQVAVDLGYQDIAVTEDSPDGTYLLTAALYDPEAGEATDPVEVVPTHSLSVACLILAVTAIKAPDAPYGVAAVFDLGALRVASEHPTYTDMLTGHRQRFGVG